MIRATSKQPDTFHAVIGDVLIEAVAADKTGPRRFSTVAYTGGELVVARYSLPVVVDLAGLSMSKSIKANLDHERTKRVGHIDQVTKTETSLTLSGLVSASGAAATEFIEGSDNGYPWQASIEAEPKRLVEVKDGKQVNVNGQTFTGPLYVARQSKLRGIAFVDRGADENSSVSLAASASDVLQKEILSMELQEWIEAMGLDYDKLSERQRDLLTKKYNAEIKAAAKLPGVVTEDKEPTTIVRPAFDLDELKAAFATLDAQIDAKALEYGPKVMADKLAEIKAKASKDCLDLRKKSLEEKWATARFECEAVKAASALEVALIRAERPNGIAIHSSTKDASSEVIEAALCLQRGFKDIEKQFKPEVLEAADKNFRRISLQQVLIMAAAANGLICRAGDRIHSGNIREVLEYAFPPRMIQASLSTLSLPNIFSNLANKDLEAGYMEEDQTWREIAIIKNVSDLKAYITHRMLDDMEYEELPKGDSMTHGKLGDETYSRQAKRYAKIFSLDEIDILNDDLSAMDDLRTRVGAGAAKKFNNVFWTKFLDNATLFTADRGNYFTGSTTNLGLDGVGLEQGVTKFRKLRTPSADGSKRVGGRPEILLCPPELEFIADRLYTGSNIVAGSGATEKTLPDRNIHTNKYRPVVCDWLSDEDFDGASSTAWYLFRNPRVLAAMVVSFLDGQQIPTVQTADVDFSRCGIQLRGIHYFGADHAEYIAGVKSKGAA